MSAQRGSKVQISLLCSFISHWYLSLTLSNPNNSRVHQYYVYAIFFTSHLVLARDMNPCVRKMKWRHPVQVPAVREGIINLQSLEDMQVGYILQKYTLDL